MQAERWKTQKGILEIENTVTEMKSTSGKLPTRLPTTEERIADLKDRSIETSKFETQTEKKIWKNTEENIDELGDNYQRYNNTCNINSRRKTKKGTEAI